MYRAATGRGTVAAVPTDARDDGSTAFYDEVWSRFAALDARSPAARHRRRLVVDRVAAALRARPLGAARPRLLDVGTGPGHLLRALAEALPTLELAGADLSPRSLELARRAGVPAKLFPLDLESPGLAGEQAARLAPFDVVVCSEVLEHLRDDRAAVRHLRALLAPGGTLVVTVPGGTPTRFDLRIGHRRHYGVRELGTLLAAEGFRPESVVAWGFPFHSAYRAAVRLASAWRLRSAPGASRTGDAHDADASLDDSPADRPSGVRDVDGVTWRAAADPVTADATAEIGPRLTAAYGAAARLLDPLFYLNLPWGGEQLVAVARREE